MKTQITNHLESIRSKCEAKINEIKVYQTFVETRVGAFERSFDTLEALLNKSGFSIERIGVMTVTGNALRSEMIIDEQSKLHVSLTVKMVGKRKPLTGLSLPSYDRRNKAASKRTGEIAAEVAKSVKDALNISFSINSYSLGKSEGILADCWI